MEPVKQEDDLGCAVACVAFVLDIIYRDATELFKDGKTRVKSKANFYCPEIVKILSCKGFHYKWKKLKSGTEVEIYQDNSIVFIKRSSKYPYGHFLVRHAEEWMDPWINLPDENIKAGFRKNLPGIPTYAIYQDG